MSIKVIDFWKMYFFFPRAEITLKFNYPQKGQIKRANFSSFQENK